MGRGTLERVRRVDCGEGWRRARIVLGRVRVVAILNIVVY